MINNQLRAAGLALTQRKSQVWIYVAFLAFNPMIVGMSIRGSNDNMIALLVLISVFLVLKKRYVLGGLLYGLSIHFKIYPIIYCFVFYFFIDCDRELIASGKPFKAMWSKKGCGFFTKNRVVFTFFTVLGLVGLTALYYQLYGMEFINEAYLYHLTRRDNRHNMSVYWYLIYQLYDEPSSTLISLLLTLPQAVVVLSAGFMFYYDVYFAMLIQTWAFVMFNKVCTAQYFLWFLTLVPIVLINSSLTQKGSKRQILVFGVAWLVIHFLSLLPCKWFEFDGLASFDMINYGNYLFFFANAFCCLGILAK